HECMALMKADGIDESTLEVLHQADMCFVGQSHYVEVQLDPDSPELLHALTETFAQQYELLYGHYASAPLRLINLRVVMRASRERAVSNIRPPDVSEAFTETRSRQIMTARTAEFVDATVIPRDAIQKDEIIEGPAIVEQADTTILIDS